MFKKRSIMPPNFNNENKIGGHTKPREKLWQAIFEVFKGVGPNIPSPDAPVCDLYQLNL
jgi:hypothetical protein